MSTHCVKIKSLCALDREKSPVSTFWKRMEEELVIVHSANFLQMQNTEITGINCWPPLSFSVSCVRHKKVHREFPVTVRKLQ